MRPKCHLIVAGASTHIIPMTHLAQLQALIGELGAANYPLLLRLGSRGLLKLQPVTARAVLSELEVALSHLRGVTVPVLLFGGESGQVLGGMLSHPSGEDLFRNETIAVTVTEDGISLTVTQFPPPVGFRSAPGLKAGTYLCFFDQITRTRDGFMGMRTAAMGGSGAPVSLPEVPIPPVTAWDFAGVAGKPVVAELRFMRMPVADAFRDVIHALVTATNDSLRLRAQFQVRID